MVDEVYEQRITMSQGGLEVVSMLGKLQSSMVDCRMQRMTSVMKMTLDANYKHVQDSELELHSEAVAHDL